MRAFELGDYGFGYADAGAEGDAEVDFAVGEAGEHFHAGLERRQVVGADEGGGERGGVEGGDEDVARTDVRRRHYVVGSLPQYSPQARAAEGVYYAFGGVGHRELLGFEAIHGAVDYECEDAAAFASAHFGDFSLGGGDEHEPFALLGLHEGRADADLVADLDKQLPCIAGEIGGNDADPDRPHVHALGGVRTSWQGYVEPFLYLDDFSHPECV